jgi:hypothetical protein
MRQLLPGSWLTVLQAPHPASTHFLKRGTGQRQRGSFYRTEMTAI